MENDEIIKIEQTDEELINRYIKEDSNNKIDVIHNDNDRDYINSNNESFSNLLDIYVKNANENLRTKLLLKKIFFYVCLAILVSVFLLLGVITIFCLTHEISTNTLIATVINMIVSFLSAFIILPHTVAQYLYNSEEEKNMTDLVKNIQERDKSIRENMKK